MANGHWITALERDLDATDDDIFVLRSDLPARGAPAVEIASVVIEHQLDVPVQIPICSHAPGPKFVRGSRRCKKRRSEQLLIKRQLAISCDQFQCAPAVLAEIEWMPWLHRRIGILFAGNKP